MDTTNTYLKLGDSIRLYRKKRGYTQAELSRKSGINEVQIRRYELNNATPRINQLRKIANALDINIYELYNTAINSKNGDIMSTFSFLGDQLNDGIQGLLNFLSMHGIEYIGEDSSFIFEETGEKYILDSNLGLFFDSTIEQLKFLIRLLAKKTQAPEDIQHNPDIMNDDTDRK